MLLQALVQGQDPQDILLHFIVVMELAMTTNIWLADILGKESFTPLLTIEITLDWLAGIKTTNF